MSKYVKELMMDQLRSELDGSRSVLILDLKGLDAVSENQFRRDLRKKSIRIRSLKNTPARPAGRRGARRRPSPAGPRSAGGCLPSLIAEAPHLCPGGLAIGRPWAWSRGRGALFLVHPFCLWVFGPPPPPGAAAIAAAA